MLRLLLLLTTLAPPLAFAAGTVSGTLTVDGTPIPLKYAYAHLHDNAEGLLDRRDLLRILLVDREVPSTVLDGIAFIPATDLAQRGELQGLMLTLDPDDPGSITATLLYPRPDPGYSLITQTLSATGSPLFSEWKLTSQSVAGAIEHADESESEMTDFPRVAFAVSFDAPLWHEPRVTADITGKDVKNSQQVMAITARAKALAAGKLDEARTFSTRGSNVKTDSLLVMYGEELAKLARKAGADMKKMIGKAKRVVVRGDRAVVLFPESQWANLLLEDGAWKVDD